MHHFVLKITNISAAPSEITNFLQLEWFGSTVPLSYIFIPINIVVLFQFIFINLFSLTLHEIILIKPLRLIKKSIIFTFYYNLSAIKFMDKNESKFSAKVQQIKKDIIIEKDQELEQSHNFKQNQKMQESKQDDFMRNFSEQQPLRQADSNIGLQSPNHQEQPKLQSIQRQRNDIVQQLRVLDRQIAQMRGKDIDNCILRKRQKIVEDQAASKRAIDLVRHFKNQKRQTQQKKKQYHQKTMTSLKKSQEQQRQRRQSQQKQKLQQKRRVISLRMTQEQKSKQVRKLIDNQSNRLVSMLIKEQSIIKMKQSISNQSFELEKRVKREAKNSQSRLEMISEHQKKYMKFREQISNKKKQQSSPINHPIKKYSKNKWAERLQQQKAKQLQQERYKQLTNKLLFQKRIKYGELITNVFLEKSRFHTEGKVQQDKINKSKSINYLPEIQMRDKISKTKGLQRRNDRKQIKTSYSINQEQNDRSKSIKQASPEDLRDRYSRKRQVQIRIQTKKKLMEIQNKSLEILPNYKPQYRQKYQNYLGRIKIKKRDQASIWQKIISNKSLSKYQKYNQMIKRTEVLQNKARQREEVLNSRDEEVVDMYISCIQAKIALLQKI